MCHKSTSYSLALFLYSFRPFRPGLNGSPVTCEKDKSKELPQAWQGHENAVRFLHRPPQRPRLGENLKDMMDMDMMSCRAGAPQGVEPPFGSSVFSRNGIVIRPITTAQGEAPLLQLPK